MILIIEDDKFTKSIMMETLANAGYDVAGHANTGKEGLEMVMEYGPDVITLDYMLPDMNGRELLEKIMRNNNHSKVILISAISDSSVMNDCHTLGIFEYLTKPVDPDALRTVVNRAYASLQQEATILKMSVH